MTSAGTRPTVRVVGNVMLGLSLLTFAIFFLNVLIGGPMRSKPWMSDVGEMLTLFLAVIFFVAGTLAREAEAKLLDGQKPASGGLQEQSIKSV